MILTFGLLGSATFFTRVGFAPALEFLLAIDATVGCVATADGVFATCDPSGAFEFGVDTGPPSLALIFK